MPRPTHALALLLLAAGVLAALPGCNLLGGAAHVLTPEPLVEARYELPDVQTLIIVEDRGALIQDPSVVRQITASIRGALEDKEIITAGFVPQTELAALQGELGPSYRSTTLLEIGRRLGAQQIIYASVTGYQLEIGGGLYQPKLEMNVKVYDVEAGGRAFPEVIDPETGIARGQSSQPVVTAFGATNRTAEGRAARNLASRELADEAGLNVARLFFDWRPPGPGSRLRDDQP